jgi:co-chaperonin GroES (HSP10)
MPSFKPAPTGNLALRPIHDQILVRQDPVKEKLDSGLYLPDVASRALQEDLATVLTVGPGALEVQVGDRVLFKRRAGTALISDPREGGPEEWTDLLMLRETDIIGVVSDEA